MHNPFPLPKDFAYLAAEPGPRILLEALQYHNLQEVPGPSSSPTILAWAKSVGASSYYKSDLTPWCALGMAAWAKAADFPLPHDPLRAASWATFGTAVAKGKAALGDVLVMERVGGGHVTLYVGETETHYLGLGANQGDAVSFAAFPKSRITHIRRCPWKRSQPENVRPIPLKLAGVGSQKES